MSALPRYLVGYSAFSDDVFLQGPDESREILGDDAVSVCKASDVTQLEQALATLAGEQAELKRENAELRQAQEQLREHVAHVERQCLAAAGDLKPPSRLQADMWAKQLRAALASPAVPTKPFTAEWLAKRAALEEGHDVSAGGEELSVPSPEEEP